MHFLTLVQLFSLLITSQALWVLETNYNAVEVGVTKNVYLYCHYDAVQSQDDKKVFGEIVRIRLYRVNPVTLHHDAVADIRSSITNNQEEDTNIEHNFDEKAHPRKSFIKITWPVATNRTLGHFGCEVNGYNTVDERVESDIPEIVIAVKKYSTEELKMFIEQLKSDFQEKEMQRNKEIAQLKQELASANRNSTNALQLLMESIELNMEMISNLTGESQKEKEQIRKKIKKEREYSDEEDMKVAQAISHLKNDTLKGLKEQKSEMEKDIQLTISKLNATYEKSVSSLREEIYMINNNSLDGANNKFKELEVMLEKAFQEMSDKSRKGDDKLSLEIMHLENKTSELLTRKIEKLEENIQANNSNQRDEDRKTITSLELKISKIRNSTVSEIRNQKEDLEIKLGEEISKLKDLGLNQTSQGNAKVLAIVNERISEQKNESNAIGTKLQEVIKDKEAQSRQVNETLDINMKELKEFTARVLLNQSEDYDGKLVSALSNLQSEVRENQTRLQLDLLANQNKSDARLEKLSDTLMDLQNDTIKRREVEYSIHEMVLDVKHYTDGEIAKVGQKFSDKIEEEIIVARNDVGISNNKTQLLKEELQEKISNIKNFTLFKLRQQKEEDKSLQQELTSFKHLVQSDYITHAMLSNKISSNYNSTIDVIKEQDERISVLKNFTVDEFTKFNQRIQDLTLLDIVRKETQECKYLYSELKSNFSESNDRLANKLDVLEKNSYEADRRADTILNNFNNTITFSLNKYQTVTDSLRTDLTLVAKCACPSAINPTAEGTTQEGRTGPTEPSSKDTDRTTERPFTTTPTTVTTPKIDEWPEGTYALVQPEAGCPISDGVTWETGFINFHTSSDLQNDDLVSTGNHFKKPIFNFDDIDSFMRISYCLRRVGDTNARKWPKGSYCMNRVGGKCPSDFVSGYIQYDGEHTHAQHKYENAPDVRSAEESLDRVYYCCRKDGPASTAIYLPNTSPFYLYRENKAVCQRVSGMKVRSEIIQIDTNHEDNRDGFEKPDTHPFANLHPVNHTLCYYTPIQPLPNSR